jgi:SAM-dependent methyltransferase
MTRLNLCCGPSIIEGFVNIDAWPGPGVDVVSDVRELQYPQASVDEVVMFHCIEHFTLDDACALIRKVFGWLKPGGHLIVEGPDVFKAVKNTTTGEFEAIRGIFGDIVELRNGKGNYQHLWGWTGSLMQQEMTSAGYNVGPVEDGLSHADKGWRDYRVVGFKPEKEAVHGV